MSDAARTPGNPADDATVACDAARSAARVLLRIRTEAPPDQLGRRGDRGAQEAIARVLADRRPADAMLSEEDVDRPDRLSADRVWIVDPLDGTREYGEPPRVDWAVHVALWERGRLAVGAVALPGLGATLRSDAPPTPPPAAREGLRIAVSRTRAPSFTAAVADELGATLVPLGSAGYKVAAVVRGEVDAYLHGGGQYEWDSAAPVAIAQAAGLHASRLDGGPLSYNRPDPRLPDLLVCRSDLAAGLLKATSRALERVGTTS